MSGKAINLVGQIFDRLLVIKQVERGNQKCKSANWLCLCECANTTIASSLNLKRGDKKSCGCLYDERRKYSRQEASSRCVYKEDYSDGNLTFEQFYKMSQQNCTYCNKKPSNRRKIDTGDEFIFNGLDRINSNKPHDLDNCVPCCWRCNRMKNKRPQKEFINWAKQIQLNIKSNGTEQLIGFIKIIEFINNYKLNIEQEI